MRTVVVTAAVAVGRTPGVAAVALVVGAAEAVVEAAAVAVAEAEAVAAAEAVELAVAVVAVVGGLYTLTGVVTLAVAVALGAASVVVVAAVVTAAGSASASPLLPHPVSATAASAPAVISAARLRPAGALGLAAGAAGRSLPQNRQRSSEARTWREQAGHGRR